MILGYEEPVLMPTMDIYSTDLMKMYIAGVKEQYDRGLKEYDDFIKQYQDFYSPIQADNQRYYDITLGGALKMIADAAKNGIDLFKSPEGRTMIRQYIQGVNPAEVNALRQSAANAQEWVKARNKLAAEGRYDPRMNQMMGGSDIANWDTSKNGVFSDTSPFEAKSLRELTSDFYKNLKKDEFLGNDPSMGKDAPFYGLYGSSEGTLSIADKAALEDLARTPYYNVYMQEALSDPAVQNGTKTPEQALAQLVRSANEPYWAQPEQKLLEMPKERWKEANARARAALRANSTRNNNNNQPKGLVSYINSSQEDGIKHILKVGNSDDIRVAQNKIITLSTGTGFKASSVLDALSTTDDNTGYNKWKGAKEGSITLTKASVSRLYTAEEVCSRIAADYDTAVQKKDKNGNEIWGMESHKNPVLSNNAKHKGDSIRSVITNAFDINPTNNKNNSTKSNKNTVTVATESATERLFTPKMSAQNRIITIVDSNGVIQLYKPVTVTYRDANYKKHSYTMYDHLAEGDRYTDGTPVDRGSFSAIDGQFTGTYANKSSKVIDYSQYNYPEEYYDSDDYIE